MRADDTPVGPVRPSWLVWPLALVVGLFGGVATSYGQTILGGGWAALANSASPWVMFAFAAGVLVPGRWVTAALAGLLTQVGLVVGYYATTELRGFAAGMAAIVIWVAAGAVAGPVYGAAGSLFRYRPGADVAGSDAGVAGERPVAGADGSAVDGSRDRWWLVRSCAAGITGSVWIMEGLNFFNLARDVNSNSGPGIGAAWVYVVVGLLLPLVLARAVRERLFALLALAVATGLALVAGIVVNAAFFI
ncbi:DUF6518 family protein [Stackebrandtia nassauensis]|uniref:Uncharacterized protein n=1 Tax=Stackebrandtia nassauensis (strain DSM 44728 / CIP 108903 / NRRL B-16338 / NBRC 102104 / LLR-40K-21) TaxID=446470 RepID=D3Q885_STANL|nr:DUF6518 family protein [Stackebrandtia nassauensis]ADD42459.1 hypothetical protein Snas_2783 [Stackebrandtia nassauensis DSM 44728]